ncbi:hypothetical protein [Kitasatospora sp. NPDC008115]|uniref:hypothetical protein n=1 Tax=Kitasatospora sp. NPDC008115 TaxID=3364022 RepID=UPI0036EE9DDD
MPRVRSPHEPPSRFQGPDFLAPFAFAATLDREAALRLLHTELDHRRVRIARDRGRDRRCASRTRYPRSTRHGVRSRR